MTEKFTPGEWRVQRYKDDPNFNLYNYLIVETVADEPLGIAAMYQRNDIESEANAALISAAPEMYRMLSGICLEKSAQICKYAPESCKVCQIRKALKHARGEE